MKRKFIAGLMLSTMIFSMTACGSSEDKKETTTIESSDAETKQEVATEQDSSEESKKTLEDAGFVLDSYEGLSYYAPPKDSYAHSEEEEIGNGFILGDKLYEYPNDHSVSILCIDYFEIDDIKISEGSYETAFLKYYLR